jgi:dolichol-phosphate mannosyltransferase
MKTLVITPTYDEAVNVRPLSEAVLRHLPETHMLFVDDNSPDGTGAILDELAREHPGVIHVIHNDGKHGLGRAYIAGFLWALNRPYELIFNMDADFSHDPKELPHFVNAMETADLVIGSRYIDGIRITNWPLSRLFLSKSAATYVRIVTGMPVHDPTGGYRCYRRQVLERISLDSIVSNGYSFLVEMAHGTWQNGFRIREIPITFEDRRAGYSKMSLAIFRESFCMVWRLAARSGFRRRPKPQRPQKG